MESIAVPVAAGSAFSSVSMTWTGSSFGLLWTAPSSGDPWHLHLTVVGCACVDEDEDGFTDCADCDDADPSVYPGAEQVCDGRNNDCDDPDWPSLASRPEDVDNDGDGLDECAGDCDDDRAAVFPGAPQLCDGVNNDCDDPTWPQAPGEEDADDDGHPACSDCAESNPSVYPGAVQACDGVNNDCDDSTWPAVSPVELDQDGDGFRGCDGDCADHDSTRNPLGQEVCNDLDDDCDTSVDEDALGEDTDADGVRNLCDNCREAGNPAQSDVDSDRIGDACDNCLVDHNPGQTDLDADVEGDVCDLDDGTIYIRFDEPTYVEWQPEIGYTSWNSYRGDLDVLRAGGPYTQLPGSNPLAARQCGLTETRALDGTTPTAGQVAFFLTTGVFGAESGLGTDSAGNTRPNVNPCP
jgi:hypothetical protein